jgi:hypothetical protein
LDCSWKANWEETKQHFIKWWDHEGMILSSWSSVGGGVAREPVADPGPPADIFERYTSSRWMAARNHWSMARALFPLDVLPIADCNMGPGSLSLALGSEPTFAEETVWFNAFMEHEERPERLPPLRFNPDSRWWKITDDALRRSAELGRGKYMVGCPDLIENIDTLASLRGTQRLLLDLAERPDWVAEKVEEINQAWFEAYNRVYDVIRLEDGSSAWSAFAIWGPGKTAKVQCDASAMFSPAMFEKLVVPALTRQCDWLDYSMFHLDGHQCIPHLDALLSIESLDAIEWTTDPQVPPGGSPKWYGMYRRIIAAGKSVQAVGIQHSEIVPLLDAVGPKGLYIMTGLGNEAEAEKVRKMVEPYC